MEYVIIALLAVVIVGLAIVIVMLNKQKSNAQTGDTEEIVTEVKSSEAILAKTIETTNQSLSSSIFAGVTATNAQVLDRVTDISKNNAANTERIRKDTVQSLQEVKDDLKKSLAEMRKELNNSLNEMRTELNKNMADSRGESARNNAMFKQETANTFTEIKNDISKKLTEVKDDIVKSVKEMSDVNEKQLNEMRGVVDEKLAKTLDERLTNNFNAIAERLESLNKGLGTLEGLTTGVTDLKKVLTNVKTRGTYGEVSLEAILEDVLTAEQFERNCNVAKNRERVDFAVILPGEKDEKVYLPIDVKFPLEDYYRLVDASENGDKSQYDACAKQLEAAVKKQARSIKDKYIVVPKTTDFAIMYLPTEGLYAEVVKQAGLVEQLQREHSIIPAGPTNITAMLSSLRVGFRTLAMQKCSKEIYGILSKFNKEFSSYIKDLENAKEKVGVASTSLDSATSRTRKIQKHLEKAQKTGEASGMIDTISPLIGLDN
ncbi:MAG: DNA recombination protein RmuC [Bacillota bacterium]